MASSSDSGSVRHAGLTVLSMPEGPEVIADIVFVHGLQGHAMDTWTAKSTGSEGANSTKIESKAPSRGLRFWSKKDSSKTSTPKSTSNIQQPITFWPYHLLREDCKKARILTWGYNSNVSEFFDGSANKGTILSHSRDLLGDLMLLRANDSEKERERNIYESTNAILFLGTPHRGGNFTEWGETARRIVSAVGFDTSRQNIRDLTIDSSTLEDYHERFLKLYNKRKFEICTFQEARGMTGTSFLSLNQKVVDDVSSTFTGTETRYAIDANHIAMCRYSSKEDDGYRKVSRELRVLCGDIEKRVKEEDAMKQQKPYISSLAFPEMNYRQEEVQDARLDSCTWILQHPIYETWLADNHGLLWIQGKPGSGKSTLMKRIFQALCHEKSILGRIHLAFFFHRRGTPLQHTSLGMFRTMLHQLLAKVPSVSADFLKLCEEKRNFQGNAIKDWEWREPELRRVFKSSLILAAKTHAVVIFVDALDEAGEDPARSIISYLHELKEQLLQSNCAVRICFACRFHPVVRTSDGIEICVDDENFKDISAYALSELRRQILPRGDDLDALQARISNKAFGVFLWVALVIPVIAKQYNEGRSMKEILEVLENTPPDLKAIYKHILGLIDPAFQRRTLYLMEWICLATRPLSLTELRYALAMDDSSIHPFQESAQESAGFVESNVRMKDMAIGLSGGLAEVKLHYKEHIIQFIHQSVNDFLLKDGFAWLDNNSAGNAIGRGHDRLARSCINYLKLGEVERAATLTSSDTSNLPFLTYSTKSWFLHAEKAESWNIPQRGLIQRFQWPTAPYFSNWINLFGSIDKYFYDTRHPKEKTTLMHVAAASNLESIVKALLESHTSVETKDAEGDTALHDAARWGHKKMVHMLLDAGADPNARDIRQRTPLERAGAGGHSEAVKLLLETGAEVNHETGSSGSALQSAALGGRWVTVKLLLDNGANINAQSGDYGNALQAAAAHGYEAVVKLLLDNGANINAQGGYHGNALQAAAADGHEAVIKLLLDNGANINAQGGDYGNALQAAAADGHEAVIKLLLDNGANINAQGGDYGNALQAAAANKYEAIVKLLLDNGANINAQGGHYGNALQAAAACGHEAVVKLLLDNRANINGKDSQGRLVLHLAMRNVDEEENQVKLIKYLLSAGAKPEWTYADRQGCSALHFAASGGSVEALKLILSFGINIDVNMPDSHGWTPLHWACRNGDTETVQLLIDNGAGLQNKNMQAWTPLDVAIFCGNDHLISTLSQFQESAGAKIRQNIFAAAPRTVFDCNSCFHVSAIQFRGNIL
ncbi:uncharacterized protein PAC_02723 [Phialocephala subalpina]|uniref:NACHT domain-containing protein n=1 Tax=Phialocephala subalpina TaxID=576137 RepID=A0A1L7WJA9_9HELO|nr:uncharacterized protein PAC_02723 [Phialocephala subalpina]